MSARRNRRKCWWAVGIFKNEDGAVFSYSVEIPRLMSGAAIDRRLRRGPKGDNELVMTLMVKDEYSPMQWRSESPPTIVGHTLWGDGEGIDAARWKLD